MIHVFGRRRRRVVPLLLPLLVAAWFFGWRGFFPPEAQDRSASIGGGFSIAGIRLSNHWFDDDNVHQVSSSPKSNPLFDPSVTEESPVIGNWPPQVGGFYPDLILTDQNGDRFQLSDLAGKVILLELAAVPCAGCQAFAGGNQRGGFGGVNVQKGLDSIHDYARRFAHVDLAKDKNVVLIQLLLYGKSMSHPTEAEVKGWAEHFGMNRTKNQIVLRGDRSMVSRESYNMIPGFHLIDDNFVLRFDSSGHHPKHDLYRDLLPAMGQLVRQSENAQSF